ncbi:CatB-related O-acetyltransferase [uncultured Salegentibacter sp.]|uniref:CatB-related O-acetyltransferase n=1 Tax=uncultured Salegentibacter sp. TaxID=259320 RepID=UPI0025971366|nr:CatB-related O-acetyltransferase [uncultured Salegentibacter sp.]
MLKKILFLFKNILRLPLDKIKDNNIHFTSRLSGNTKISRTDIGKNCYIACNTVIVNTKVGNYCSIAPGVQIGGMEHSYWWYSTSTFLSNQCKENNRVNIGSDVWIAGGAIIKQGITIGNGSVIGALSFVNKDVPENSIVIGSPARIIKQRFDSEVFAKLKRTRFWEYDVKEAKLILEEFEMKYKK